ncbi:MAG: ArnT family glycosyltransferase [Pyrinomonadaceae bacterium]
MKKLTADIQQVLEDFGSLIGAREQYIVLGLLMLLVLLVRLAAIHTPSLEWTAWKEIDYIYISQNFAAHGFNFFMPEVGWPADLPRVTEMEFPLVPYAAALLYKVFGFNVYSVRLVTLIAALLLIFFVFKLVRRELGPFEALIAAFASGVLPLYHPFGNLLFTEPLMIAFSVGSLYYIAEWVDHRRNSDWIVSLALFSLTIALKIETLYLLLPIAWIFFRKYRFDLTKYKKPALLIAMSLILPVLWYSYAFYLESIGAHVFGIFKGHNKSQTLTMLLQPIWYRAMAERVIYDILGGFYGTLLFLIGLGAAAWLRRGGLIFAYLASIGCYFAIVAEGNIDAPYRQLTVVPAASAFIAFGTTLLIAFCFLVYRNLVKTQSIQKFGAIAALAGSLAIVSIIPLRHYRQIFTENAPRNRPRWDMSRTLRSFSNSETKVVVIGEWTKHVGGYDVSPVLYYYSGLQGWTLTPEKWNLEEIDRRRKNGATLFVAVPPYETEPPAYQPEESPQQFLDEMRARFPLLYEDQGQLIFDLTRER